MWILACLVCMEVLSTAHVSAMKAMQAPIAVTALRATWLWMANACVWWCLALHLKPHRSMHLLFQLLAPERNISTLASSLPNCLSALQGAVPSTSVCGCAVTVVSVTATWMLPITPLEQPCMMPQDCVCAMLPSLELLNLWQIGGLTFHCLPVHCCILAKVRFWGAWGWTHSL